MKTGIELIAEERERQKTQEGWTAKHDDQHDNCEMNSAACCYAAHADDQSCDFQVITEVPDKWP